MEIIVEDVFLSNLTMNLAILFFTRSVTSNNAKKIGIILVAIVVSVISLFYPLFVMSNFATIVVKLLLGAGIVLTAFKIGNIKNFLYIYLIFMLSTAVFGGLSFAIVFLVNGTSANPFDMNAQSLPLAVIYSISILTVMLVKSLVKKTKKNMLSSQLTYFVTLSSGKVSQKFLAFLDTGNTLVDPATSKPIIMISASVFEGLFGKKSLIDVFLKRYDNLCVEKPHLVNVSGVGKESKIFVFELSKATILLDKKTKDINCPLAGLSFSSFEHLGCKGLLNPLMLID
ncbi:MAG: sigma-E processing peptidase SpoIIGA [Clostridia bacterium]